MQELRIENLRTLKETGLLKIRPITVLLGNNSSGKSTFLRLFPLLRQSVEEHTRGPLLWFGRLVDFGSFQEALSNFVEGPKEIRFSIRFDTDSYRMSAFYRHRRHLRITTPGTVSIEHCFSIAGTANGDSSYVNRWRCQFADNLIELSFSEDGKITLFSVNGRDLTSLMTGIRADHVAGILPKLRDREPQDPDMPFSMRRNRSPLFQNLVRTLSAHVHHRTGEDRVQRLASSIGVGSSAQILETLKTLHQGGDHFQQRAREWTTASPPFLEIRDAALAISVEGLLAIVNEQLTATFQNVNYIAPVRATAERYYRIQDLSIESVDPQGRNLAVFLRSLTWNQQKNFEDWTRKYFGFVTEVKTSGGHISLHVRQNGSESNYNLADIGFGFSQVLPVVTQLWLIAQQRGSRHEMPVPVIFCIEQPELHLHPKFQAVLADAFVAAVKAARSSDVDLRIIIETHSETIVNQLVVPAVQFIPYSVPSEPA